MIYHGYIMQWFLEFLGFREPPGAPVAPRGEPSKGPKLYVDLVQRKQFFIIAFSLLVSTTFLVSKPFQLDWLVFGGIAIGVLWFIYSTYTKRRWRALREQAKAAGYLHCPTCNHDLRGTRLKDSTAPITAPLKAATNDLVICPECGEEHRVKDLGEIWELP